MRLPIGLVALVLLLAACAPPSVSKVARASMPRDTHPAVPSADMEALAAGNNAFGLDLYHVLSQQAGNFVYSPYSLSSALAMTYAGARSETETQMAASMHFGLAQAKLHPAFNQLELALARMGKAAAADEHPLQLTIANAIWVDGRLDLLEEYLGVMALNYGAGIHLADFLNAFEPARREINSWVSQQTQRKIDELVPEGALDPSTLMVLVNAIYFKGDWQNQFDADDTHDAPFYPLDGSQVAVSMMNTHLSNVPYAELDGFQAVELPYQGGSAVMDVIVPEPGRFDAFESALDAKVLEELLAGMRPAALQLGMPKFSFRSAFDVGEQLAGMGMPNAFDPDLADFSGMTGGRDLYIDKVLHQAFVAVDEKGTEAAAATAVIMGPTSAMLPDLVLLVDRPFIFIIRDLGTKQILFMGRVLDPTK